jgi:hypothetical protein
MKYLKKIPSLIVKAPANLFELMVRWSDNFLVQILLWRVKHFLGEMLSTKLGSSKTIIYLTHLYYISSMNNNFFSGALPSFSW